MMNLETGNSKLETPAAGPESRIVNPVSCEVSLDLAGLAEHAYRMIEHAAKNQGARMPAAPPAIPDPYARWLEHLGRVHRALDLVPALGARIPADTVRGLAALDQARDRFRRNYKSCPGCGRFIIRLAKRCPCGEKF